MIYKSSKGEVEISTMPISYAKNALNKLRRTEPDRTAEIEALAAHVGAAEAEATERALSGDGKVGFDKFEARAEVLNERAVIGANNPPPDEPAPALSGRPAIEVHVADLLTEAKNWADGAAIENEEQAAAVAKLHRMLEQARTLVDDAADGEKKPLNKALAEIATWQNGFTAKGLKKTPDGSLTKAILATNNLSGTWLRKLDDDRRAREKIAADAALAAAQEAMVAREEAKTSTDLATIDKASDALADARNLLKQAEGLNKERVRVGGGEGFRAMALRSVYSAKIIDEPGSWGLAYGHYKQNPEFMAEFHSLIQRWADRDARTEATRVLGVPGFAFIEDRVAA